MKLDISQPGLAVAALGLCGLVLWSPPMAFAGEGEPGTTACFDGSPAVPVDQFRTISGQGTFELWPQNFQPADPLATPLPDDRDSTSYEGFERPGLQGGNELFWGIDIVSNSAGSYLFTAYNAGFQIWNIGGAFQAAPQELSQRDGWVGDFDTFEDPFTEEYFKNWDISAIAPVASPGATLVALAGDGPVGPTIWDAADKTDPVQLYQDTGRVGVQVATANIGGRSYAFFALNNGVHVYDMTRAREIGPCFEATNQATNLCGGNLNPVWRGRVESWSWNRAEYVNVLEATVDAQAKLFMVVSDGFFDFGPGNGLGVELREITDITALPPTSNVVLEGLDNISHGVELFSIVEDGGLRRYYTGVINTDGQTSSGLLQIYDVTACIDPASVPTQACSFSAVNRRYQQQLGDLPSAVYVHFSESNGRPFLYQSHHTLCSLPPASSETNIEHLLDLEGLKDGSAIVDVRGEDYLDPNHSGPSRRIDYWSSYYDQSTDGLSAISPHGGLFNGSYFYRVAQTLLDVHQFTGDIPPDADIQATSSNRWLSSPGQPEWVNLSGDCNLDAGTGWSWTGLNAPGTPVEDPAPVTEPLGGDLARIRGDRCGTDPYPGGPCPDRTLLVEADVTCGGVPITSNELSLTLSDPRPFFDSIDILEGPDEAGPPPEYSVCQVLSFEALNGAVNEIGGKALTSYAWAITPTSGGETFDCTNVIADTGLSCTEDALFWDTEGVDVGDPTAIFADGFESGDTSRWSSIKAAERGASGGVTFDVMLTASNEHGSIDQTTQLALTPLDSLAFIGNGFTIPGTPPADGIYNFTATAQSATSFYWEFEQDPSVPGDAGCRFVNPCEIRTTTSPTVQYEWPIDNTNGADYDVRLEISNCDTSVAPISTVRTVENVVVVDLMPPNITAFRLVTVGTSCQCFGGICSCPPGVARFTVAVSGDCDTLSFDWGDGMESPFLACDSAEYSHNYTSTGTYDLEATACVGGVTTCDTQLNLTNISQAFPVPLIVE
ncbi:MAG: hypothetical protein GY719_12500 [bacterium]|nr:hypothetical protein [bacterium]